jgi:hypothetical protein
MTAHHVRQIPDLDPVRDPEDQDQRAPRAACSDNENMRVLTLLAHQVLEMVDGGEVDEADSRNELKSMAARAGVRYDGDRTSRALDSARVQQVRLHAKRSA